MNSDGQMPNHSASHSLRDASPPLILVITVWLVIAFLPSRSVSAGQSFEATNQDASAVPSGIVLIYHRFDEQRFPTTNIAADRFEEQLVYLRDHGYKVIPLRDMVTMLRDHGTLPDRTVAITIDDGYKSTYEVAWPLLRKHGFPFTVFVYVEATNKKHRGYLSWDQIQEMRAAGVDFQNHGYSHLHMADRQPGQTDEEYRALLRADLEVSTRILAQELGQRPNFFAVPYGEYNQAVIEEVRSFGYQAIFMQDPGSISPDTDLFAIPREPILGYDWSTMDHFKMVLERVDLPFTDMEPISVTKGETPPYFSVRLRYPAKYRQDTLGVYVSELGWQPAVLHDGKVVLANDQPLMRHINRVAVSAREKDTNRTAIRFWMLVADEPQGTIGGISFGSGGAIMK